MFPNKNAGENPSVIPLDKPEPVVVPQKQTNTQVYIRRSYRRILMTLALFAVATPLILIGSIWAINARENRNQAAQNRIKNEAEGIELSSVAVPNLSTSKLYTIGGSLEVTGNSVFKNVSADQLQAQSVVIKDGGSAVTPGEIFTGNNKSLQYFDGTTVYNLTDAASQVSRLAAQVAGLPTAQAQAGLVIDGQLVGSVNLGAGLALAAGNLNNTGVLSIQGQTGAVSLSGGAGIAISGTTVTNQGVISLVSGSSDIQVLSDGSGNYTVAFTGSGASGAVALGPLTPQDDASNNPAIAINKLGTGNLLQLAVSGTNRFVVNQTGAITVGSIDFAQVTGKPTFVNSIGGLNGAVLLSSAFSVAGNTIDIVAGPATVSSIDGTTGAFLLGSGLSRTGQTLSNSGVTSVNGTANQVTVNASTGAVTFSLPQNIATTSSPTFAGLTVSGLSSAGVVRNSAGGVLSTGQVSLSSEVTGILPVINGGTGAITGSGARTNLGAAASGANGDITGLSAVTSIANASAGLTVGSTAQALVLQGDPSSNFAVTGGGFTTTVGFNGVPTAAVTYNFDRTAAAGTYTVCSTVGNCAGIGGSIVGTGTVSKLTKFTGSGTVGDSILSEVGSTITNSGNFVIQGSSALTLGVASSVDGAIVFRNATGTHTVTLVAPTSDPASSLTFSLPSADGGNGDCLKTDASGHLSFGTCLSGVGGGGGVVSLNGLSGTLTLANATGSGATVTINDATTAAKGIASFNSTNFTVTTGAVNTIQNIAVTSSPTFMGLTVSGLNTAGIVKNNASGALSTGTVDLTSEVNGILPVLNGGTGANTAAGARTNLGAAASGANSDITSLTGVTSINNASAGLTVGNTGQGLILQGNASSTFAVTGGGFTTTLGFSGSPTGAVTYNFDRSVAAGTYTICTTIGNCAGTGGGITGAGTNGRLTKFTGASTVGDSILSESGSTITNTGNFIIQGANALTLGTSSSIDGAVIFRNAAGTHTVGLVAPTVDPLSDLSFRLPNADGSSGDCLKTDASGNLSFGACLSGSSPAGGVVTLNGIFGTLSIANATGAGATITIDNATTAAKGIASFNSTNFTVTTGAVNTIQNIATSSSPSFTGLTVSGLSTAGVVKNNSSGVLSTGQIDLTTEVTGLLPVANGGTNANTAAGARTNLGAAASGANNDITSLTGVTSINNASAGLSVGNTGQALTLQGNASSTFAVTGGGFTTSVGFNGSPTAAVTYNFDRTAAAGTYAICTSSGNCLGGGGGGANTALSNLTGVALNTSLLTGSAVIDLGSSANPFRDLYLGGTATNNFRFTGVASAARTLTLPDASGTLAVSASGNIALSATGNITFTGLLPVANGGTNANTAAGARTSLGAAASGANGDITSLTAVTSVANASAGLTVGNAGQVLTLQGDASSTLGVTGGGFTTTLGFSGSPTGLVTYNLDRAVAAGTYTLCSTIGNCAGSGGGIIGSGTSGRIAKFTGTGTIGDSLFSESGTTLTAGGLLSVQGAASGDALTVSNSTSTGNIAVFRDNATAVLTIADGGSVLLQPTVNSTTALNVRNAAGDNMFTVDTTNGHVGIRLLGANTPQAALHVRGSQYIDGNIGALVQVAPPSGVGTVGAKLGIEVQTLAAFDQVLAVGVNSASAANSRVITAFDQRATTNNQPAIGVISPNETQIFGLGWDGANTTGYIKSMGTDIGIKSNTTVLANFSASTGITLQANTAVTGTLSVGSLGSVTTNSQAVCRDTSTSLLTACDSGAGGKPFIQGGNTFGVAGDIGTNDNFDLNFRTNNATKARLTTAGNLVFMQSATILNFAAPTASNLTLAAGWATGSGNVGGTLALNGGLATAGNANGGNVSIQGGSSSGSGSYGDVMLQSTGGKVGIGLSGTPSELLSVGGTTGNFTVNSSGDAIARGSVIVDRDGNNSGTASFALLFGDPNSGEGIGSKRNAGGNQNGLDFYTNFTPVLRLSSAGAGTFTGTLAVQGASATVGTSSQLGSLILNDGNGGQTATIRVDSNIAANTVLKIRDTVGASDFFCLETLANCAGSTTLQAAYNNDVDGSNATIALTTADDSLIIQNPASGGTDSTFALKIDQLATGAVEGLRIESAGTGNLLTVRDTTATARDVFTLANGGAVTFSNQTNSTAAFQIQNAGGANLFTADTTNAKLTLGGDLVANGGATGTTATTSGTGTNTTTVTLTGSAFTNGDVILIDNAGQDYYTRITAGGGSASLTVSPAVTFETARTVTKYTIQNIGATNSDYTSQSNRFFQGYFLGGIVTGAGSTVYSDGVVKTGTTGLTVAGGSNSTTAFQVQDASGASQINVNTLGSTGNIWPNPSFEQNINGAVSRLGATINYSDGSTTPTKFGAHHLDVLLGTSAGSGVEFRAALKPSTTYSVSVWARQDAPAFGSDYRFGRSDNGPDSDCTISGSVSITLSATYTQYTCTFTTGATVNETSSIYFKSMLTNTYRFFLDGLTIVEGSTPLTYTLPGAALQVEPYYNNVSFNDQNTAQLQPWRLNPTTLPAERSGAGVTTANGYIYVIGGGTGTDGETGSSTVYYAKVNADGTLSGWATNAQSLNTAIYGADATVVGNYIYLTGGKNASNVTQSITQFARLNADGSTGAWANVTQALPSARYIAAAFTANGYLYVAGGISSGNAVTNTVYYARPNNDGNITSWTTSGNVLAQNHASSQAVVLNGYVYLVDGMNAINSPTRDVAYAQLNANGTTGAWTNIDDITIEDRGAPTVATLNGYIYVTGGWDGASGFSKTTEHFRTKPDGSTTDSGVATNMPLLPIGLEGAKAVTVNGYLYFVGGDIGGANNGSNATIQVYYTSGPRLKVAGSLDLLGSSANDGLLAGGSGGSLTAGNTVVAGTLQVAGSANFLGNVSINQNLNVGGYAAFQNDTNSTTAFQVRNAAGTTILNVDSINGRVGIGNTAPSFKLDVSDSQASSYVARIQNSNTGTNADGLLIQLGVADTSRTNTNRFIDFSDGTTIAGNIQGVGGSCPSTCGVAYATTGADYAEYFRAQSSDLPVAAELVQLDQSQNQAVLRAGSNAQVPIAGVVSTSPGFIGNGPLCLVGDDNCDANYAQYNSLVALSGQVPLKVNASNGAIAIGDPITVSATIGQGAKATVASYIVGYALEPLSGTTGTIKVLVRPQYYTPDMSTMLQGQDMHLTGDATIDGSLAVGGALNVTGPVTLTSLTVQTITVTTLTVTNATVNGTLTVNGHIITAGDTPTVVATAAAGQGAAVTISGNDTAGVVMITTGSTGLSADALSTITFNQAYGAAPRILITPVGNTSASLQYNVSNVSATHFSLSTANNPAASTTYIYNYQIMQ